MIPDILEWFRFWGGWFGVGIIQDHARSGYRDGNPRLKRRRLSTTGRLFPIRSLLEQVEEWLARAERLRESFLGHLRLEWHIQCVEDRRAEVLRAHGLVLHG